MPTLRSWARRSARAIALVASAMHRSETPCLGSRATRDSGLLRCGRHAYHELQPMAHIEGVADNDEIGQWIRPERCRNLRNLFHCEQWIREPYGHEREPSETSPSLGIYMTDPNLNLIDPNNTTSGLGGALVADLDSSLNGTGVLIPQTDTATDSFAGNYAFGAQGYYLSEHCRGLGIRLCRARIDYRRRFGRNRTPQ